MPRRPVQVSRQPLLWLVALGFFMQTLDSTIVNTALPSMAHSLAVSPLHMQSVVVSYALAMAALIPASGWLADRFGTRSVFLAAIVLFTLGSLGCALSQSLDQLVAARVVQGVGGAMLLPVGRLALMRTVERVHFLQAMAFISIPGLIGPLIGPALGGWLVEVRSWHWIFLINLPVGLVGALATLRWMPNVRELPPRFDALGYALLVASMLCISLALDGFALRSFGHATLAVLLVAGLGAFATYWLHALRHPRPLFPPQLFAIASFRVGTLGNLFARTGSGAMPYLMPLLLQVALGYSPAQAGMMLIPVALASMSAKPLVTRTIARFGYRRVLAGNTVLLGTLIACFGLIRADTPLWALLGLMFVFGAINSMQFTAMNTVALKDLDGPRASAGNAMHSMVQMLAMSLGVTVASALLAAFRDVLGVDAGDAPLAAFRYAYFTIGAITASTAMIFWQLPVRADRPGR